MLLLHFSYNSAQILHITYPYSTLHTLCRSIHRKSLTISSVSVSLSTQYGLHNMRYGLITALLEQRLRMVARNDQSSTRKKFLIIFPLTGFELMSCAETPKLVIVTTTPLPKSEMCNVLCFCRNVTKLSSAFDPGIEGSIIHLILVGLPVFLTSIAHRVTSIKGTSQAPRSYLNLRNNSQNHREYAQWMYSNDPLLFNIRRILIYPSHQIKNIAEQQIICCSITSSNKILIFHFKNVVSIIIMYFSTLLYLWKLQTIKH